jgi:3-methylcrotonyl-CoA carboxylase alpha subunit
MKRVLIANRGEIAIRIQKTLKRLGMETVAIYHQDEMPAPHAKYADISINLGSGSLRDTYLNIPKIVLLARDYSCDAVHPGYGFLSENHLFARACEENDIIFIGPSSDVVRLMGLKSEAKRIAEKVGVPVLDSFKFSDGNFGHAVGLTYPLIIKAVAGGGGKGLKICKNPGEFRVLVEKARQEASLYFGNDELIVEPYIEHGRHIEVQLLGDKHGNIVHLFERECTLQRKHQKIIEEAPADSISEKLRSDLHKAAIRFARALGYAGAGTVEFLVSDDRFFFLEMNTRIQVEHPVTEMITQFDLIEEQIKIALGEKLPVDKFPTSPKGYAIEVRVCAENPHEGFRPSTGKINFVKLPADTRVDTFISNGTYVSSHFDSMLGKIVVLAASRKKAIEKLKNAVNETFILGIDTNLAYLKQLLNDENYIKNNISTHYLEDSINQKVKSYIKEAGRINAEPVVLSFLFNNFIKKPEIPENIWQKQGANIHKRNFFIAINGRGHKTKLTSNSTCLIDDRLVNFQILSIQEHITEMVVDGIKKRVVHAENRDKTYDSYEFNSIVFKVSSPQILRMSGEFLQKTRGKNHTLVNQIASPLFGKVIDINVEVKERVKKGDILLTIESMKTENHILSPVEGIVESILVQEGLQVQENINLITLNPVIE